MGNLNTALASRPEVDAARPAEAAARARRIPHMPSAMRLKEAARKAQAQGMARRPELVWNCIAETIFERSECALPVLAGSGLRRRAVPIARLVELGPGTNNLAVNSL